jgi:alpha-1,3-rhamnosyl/mannosyltransferase
MSLGTPVVSRSCRCSPRWAGTPRCEPGSATPGAFADALARLADDGDLRQRLVLAGRERAAGFSWRRTGAGLLAAYSALASSS